MTDVNTKIHSIIAREILDTRGDPTIETLVVLESGYRGVASVPSGTSVSTYEAVELRDKDDSHYRGRGVMTAVRNANEKIGVKLKGMDAADQAALDKAMIDLDGTPNKHMLGANSILSVSLAAARAVASAKRLPLYRYLNMLYATQHVKADVPIKRVPTPTFNVINGGKHGAGNLDFQEFHIVPASNKTFTQSLEMGVIIYQQVKSILKYRNAVYSVGYEGGFAPNLYTNLDALEILLESIKNASFRFGVDTFLGLDIAASTFKKEHGYQIKDKPGILTENDYIHFLIELHKKYRLLILEDPLGEDDWSQWSQLSKEIGHEVLIVGDDLLATNPDRLARAIKEKACSALLAKPNQIGSLSEFLAVIAQAQAAGIKVIVSHRSGETNDDFIADLAVGVQSDYVKFGAPARGERVAKYNRLLQIEQELGTVS